jgi:hypothetical protein
VFVNVKSEKISEINSNFPPKHSSDKINVLNNLFATSFTLVLIPFNDTLYDLVLVHCAIIRMKMVTIPTKDVDSG